MDTDVCYYLFAETEVHGGRAESEATKAASMIEHWSGTNKSDRLKSNSHLIASTSRHAGTAAGRSASWLYRAVSHEERSVIN